MASTETATCSDDLGSVELAAAKVDLARHQVELEMEKLNLSRQMIRNTLLERLAAKADEIAPSDLIELIGLTGR